MQQQIPLNFPEFYVLIFAATMFFYTIAYLGEYDETTTNRRARWYRDNRKNILFTQYLLFAVILSLSAFYIISRFNSIITIPAWQWLSIDAFVMAAFLYYGIPLKKFQKYNLRKTGWLKSFVIGFVWAGMVTFIPVLFSEIEHGILYEFSLLNLWLFIKNFMYISVLCIMFDIKDYAADHNKEVKTFVVMHGLRKTIFYIIIPLCLIGFVSYLRFASVMQFGATRIFFNSIPFILLLIVAWSMKKRKHILYYLAVIDGLMLIKALCGVAGMIF